jgi:hypothetical protein
MWVLRTDKRNKKAYEMTSFSDRTYHPTSYLSFYSDKNALWKKLLNTWQQAISEGHLYLPANLWVIDFHNRKGIRDIIGTRATSMKSLYIP